ncbi:hypothetical protein [uncultured Mediterranean phage uvDeep-CGR2-KM21-C345]|nr:hypothetical protein [uncultured Mediterranean phage uvDeep-CGR2-KM21-C345]
MTMKSLEQYAELKKDIKKIFENHKNYNEITKWSRFSIDCKNMNWRTAKKIGAKKGYFKWVFFSTMSPSNGFDLTKKLQELCEGFDLTINENLI